MDISGIAYSLGGSRAGKISPIENIRIHALHAEANDGKLLVRLGKAPSAANRDVLRERKTLLLVGVAAKRALRAKIVDCGDLKASGGDLSLVPAGYENPSIWADDHPGGDGANGRPARPAWFAVTDVEEIGAEELEQIQSVNGKPLLVSLSGASPWAYLAPSE